MSSNPINNNYEEIELQNLAQPVENKKKDKASAAELAHLSLVIEEVLEELTPSSTKPASSKIIQPDFNASSSSSSSGASSNLMDQVSCGPAGLLYALSNQLIAIYSELQGLYNKVSIAETLVQESTIQAGTDAQRSNAILQASTIAAQAGEAIAGAVVTGVMGKLETGENETYRDNIKKLEGDIVPFKQLNDMPYTPIHDLGVGPAARTQVIGDRIDMLKNGTYKLPNEDEATAMRLNQEAINHMRGREFPDFKKNLLENHINPNEKSINTEQTRIQVNQAHYQQKTQMITGGVNLLGKAIESGTTYGAGAAQAGQQAASSVQQMAATTGNTASGNINQMSSKVSEALNNASSGSKANAQT